MGLQYKSVSFFSPFSRRILTSKKGIELVERSLVNLMVGWMLFKQGAILYNEAEVFSPSITNPNGRPMLPFDWLIHSSLILASCHRILFFCRFSAVEK